MGFGFSILFSDIHPDVEESGIIDAERDILRSSGFAARGDSELDPWHRVC